MRTAILLTIVLLLASCKQTEYVTIPSVERDSIYITKTERDSLFVRDSVYVKDKGDTVYVERWKTVYKSRILQDTLYISKVDSVAYPVEVVKEVPYVPSWVKWLIGVCVLFLGVIIVRSRS